MRTRLLVTAAIISCSLTLLAQPSGWPPPGHLTLELWPHGAPGAQPNSAAEMNTTTAKDHVVADRLVYRVGNVSTPTLTLYPAKANSTGAAVVVFPGGGYRILAIDLEGTEVCDWLNSINVTCVLLNTACRIPGPIPNHRLRCRTHNEHSAWFAPMRRSGTLIPTA